MIQDPIVTLGIVREKLADARKTISEQQDLIEAKNARIKELEYLLDIERKYSYMDGN